MSVGYTLRIRDLNERADPDSLGVRLGEYCIARSIPVMEVAEAFGVSRTTIYNWFCGVTSPQRHIHRVINEYMSAEERGLQTTAV